MQHTSETQFPTLPPGYPGNQYNPAIELTLVAVLAAMVGWEVGKRVIAWMKRPR